MITKPLTPIAFSWLHWKGTIPCRNPNSRKKRTYELSLAAMPTSPTRQQQWPAARTGRSGTGVEGSFKGCKASCHNFPSPCRPRVLHNWRSNARSHRSVISSIGKKSTRRDLYVVDSLVDQCCDLYRGRVSALARSFCSFPQVSIDPQRQKVYNDTWRTLWLGAWISRTCFTNKRSTVARINSHIFDHFPVTQQNTQLGVRSFVRSSTLFVG